MPSKQLDEIINMLKPNPRKKQEKVDVEQGRARLESLGNLVQVASDVSCRPVQVENIPGEQIVAPGAVADRVILYLHGGSYIYGSLCTHRELASRLSRAAGATVLHIDYRLAPENPFPAAIEDSIAAYRWLLAQGVDPARLTIAGDSAGGGLALATLVALSDAGETLPAAAVCLSPWTDLAATQEELTSRATTEVVGSPVGLHMEAAIYLNGADPRHPFASPLYADLSGLPPLLIQVGANEMLLADSTRFAKRAKDVGVDVHLEIWEDVFHVWQAFAAILPEGQQAIDHIGEFVRLNTVG